MPGLALSHNSIIGSHSGQRRSNRHTNCDESNSFLIKVGDTIDTRVIHRVITGRRRYQYSTLMSWAGMYGRDQCDIDYRDTCNPYPLHTYLHWKVRLFGGISGRPARLVGPGAVAFQESHLRRGGKRAMLASTMVAGCMSSSYRRGKKEVRGGNEWSRSGRRQTLKPRHWRTTGIRRSQCHSHG
jgi:hypothetical protein